MTSLFSLSLSFWLYNGKYSTLKKETSYYEYNLVMVNLRVYLKSIILIGVNYRNTPYLKKNFFQTFGIVKRLWKKKMSDLSNVNDSLIIIDQSVSTHHK